MEMRGAEVRPETKKKKKKGGLIKGDIVSGLTRVSKCGKLIKEFLANIKNKKIKVTKFMMRKKN